MTVGWAGFQHGDSSQMLSWENEWKKLSGKQEAGMLRVPIPLYFTLLKKAFAINVCNTYSVRYQPYCMLTLLKTSRPCRGHGPHITIEAGIPYPTKWQRRKQNQKSWNREKDCREAYCMQVKKPGRRRRARKKISNQNFVRSRWGAKINQYSEPPKLQSPLKPESGSWQNSWWIGLMSEEWNKTQHMSEPEVLGLCVIVPPMDAMCASGRSCCAAPLSTPQGHF